MRSMVFLIVSWKDSSLGPAFAGAGADLDELGVSFSAVDGVAEDAAAPAVASSAATPPSSLSICSSCDCMSGEVSSSPMSSAIPACSCRAKSSSEIPSAMGLVAVGGLVGLVDEGGGSGLEGVNSSSMSVL